jgi:hypothetical protein
MGIVLAVAACQPEADRGEPVAEPVERATAAASAPAAPSVPDEMTCSYPVRASDTADTLLRRFGDQARVETIFGPEGIELPGVALWPDDPKRRIEVVFSDEGRRNVSFAEANGASAWRAAGLVLGDPLAKAQEANGKPFELWGFSWDYGGYVSDFHGGELDALPGGCRAMLRFDVPEEADVPTGILGEVQLSSDDALLAPANARIVELALSFDPD